MKILILGGYGTFGGRLAELLAIDPRLTLVIAGRSFTKAQAVIQTFPAGAQKIALEFDRAGDVHMQLRACAPDLVIDATGPFQLIDGGSGRYPIANNYLLKLSAPESTV